MVVEIVDLPIKNGDVPSFFVCLPGRVHPGYTGYIQPIIQRFAEFFNLHPLMGIKGLHAGWSGQRSVGLLQHFR
jgi:hypothetical protein